MELDNRYPGARYHESGETRLVQNADEDAIASAEGWETTPFPPKAPVPPPVPPTVEQQRDDLVSLMLAAEQTIQSLEKALNAVTAERDAMAKKLARKPTTE